MDNLNSALAGELLANREIGLYAVCAPSDSAPMSYSYLSHCREHIKRFAQTCIDENTMGDIYRIDFDHQLARTISGSVNLFVNEVPIGRGAEKPRFIRFSLDMSRVDRGTISNTFNFDEIYVRIQFGLSKNGEEKVYEIFESIAGINAKTYALDEEEYFEEQTDEQLRLLDDYVVTLKSFTIEVPDTFDTFNQTLILHDALFCIN